MTPIMWDFNDLGLGGILQKILKLNPLFYIVQGYRDSLIGKGGNLGASGTDTLFLGVYSGSIYFRNQTVQKTSGTFCRCTVMWRVE